jgi:hypothetical protein
MSKEWLLAEGGSRQPMATKVVGGIASKVWAMVRFLGLDE